MKSGRPFLPEAWKKLASGKYLLEVTASDEHGRPCRAEQEFVLFSLKDRVPPVKTVEWFYQDGTQLEETQPVTLYVGSSEKNVHLFYHVYSGNRMLVSDSFVLNGEIRSFDYTWRPEYGDGITVSFDGNFRSTLWSFETARDVLSRYLPYVDVLIGIEPIHVYNADGYRC